MTDHATLYREAATAPGAWYGLLRPKTRIGIDDAVSMLLALHRDGDLPLNAAIHGDATADLVRLTRHPSVTYGTPTAEACAADAQRLAVLLGWRLLPVPPWQLVVPMGLREGYGADNHVSSPNVVRTRIHAHTDCNIVDAQLISSRWVRGFQRIHREPGVVIVSDDRNDLAAMIDVAHLSGQQQIAVTDFAEDRTYSLHQNGE